MIILHPTNNLLIARILIGKKEVELLNPHVPPRIPSKSHLILCGSTSRPLNKEYIEDRLTTRICRLEGVVWRGVHTCDYSRRFFGAMELGGYHDEG